MNKLAIPAILVATVMVAGIFAFSPIQEASTVHTTIQAAVGETFRISTGGQNLGNAGGESIFRLNCTDACIVESITGWTTAGDQVDIVFVVNITGVVDVIGDNLGAPAVDQDLGDIADVDAPGSQVDLLKIIQARAPAGVDQATIEVISVAANGTVEVGINNSTDANNDAFFVVVFTGKNLGNTAPTTTFIAA